jgi:hypothetical protein
MRRRQSSRYLLARLRPLGQPTFWGPAIGLLLLLLFTWDFWMNPGVKSALGIDEPSQEDVTAEDKAIGADLDSTSLLLNDIGLTPKPTTPKPQEAPLPKRSTSATPQPAPSAAASPPPETVGVENALAARYGLTNGGSVLGETAGVPAAPLPQSPLQAAIDRLQPGAAVNGLAPSPAPPAEGSAPVTPPHPPNAYTNLIGGSQPLESYSTIPAPTPLPNLSPAPGAASLGQPVPQGLGVQSPSPTVNPQPFTAPRTIPGRAIGGGNINTFSNP